MVTIETISIVFTGLSISLAAFYYINTLRINQRNQQMQLETRQLALFMPLYEVYRDREFRRQLAELRNQEWTTTDDFLQRYGPESNPDAFATRVSVGSYFDGIGVLVKRGHVDVGMVNDLIGNSIISVWEKFGTEFIDTRTRTSNPYIYTDFEYLYSEIMKYREKHPAKTT